jgi:hypothetical protein
MRSFACRRLGSLGHTFRSGPANTTIAQTTIARPHHGGQRSHAPLSFASAAAVDGRARVSCRGRETMVRCGLAGENVRPRIKPSGVAARLVFAERGIRLKPVCVADGVGWTNPAAVCEDQLAMSNARNDIALTHDKACSVIAPGACRDARAAVTARVSDRPRGTDPCKRIAWCNQARFEQRQEPRPPAKRFSTAAVAMGAGDEERAARHLAVAAARRPRSRRRRPPRCLKRLATSLEAIGGRGSGAEKRYGRREPGAAATPSARGRAFCRGVAHRGCRLVQRAGLSASSGWLRRPG